MEDELREKKVWDMSGKDIVRVLLKYWLLIFLTAVIVGGGVFIYNYYNSIVKKDYVSTIQYIFIYSVKTYDKNDQSFSWKLAPATEYIDVYTTAFTSEEVYAEVSKTLKIYDDEKIKYSVRELQNMLQLSQSGNIVTITSTTKYKEHSQAILSVVVNSVEKLVSPIIDQMKTVEADSANLSIKQQPQVPTEGKIYEKEDSLLNVALVGIISGAVVLVLASGCAVMFGNFNGRFKRRDVFENNYGIPVLGELTVEVPKIVGEVR